MTDVDDWVVLQALRDAVGSRNSWAPWYRVADRTPDYLSRTWDGRRREPYGERRVRLVLAHLVRSDYARRVRRESGYQWCLTEKGRLTLGMTPSRTTGGAA